MSYLKDFMHFNSGTECPDSFWLWSGLTLLGHVAGRKIWYHHGDLDDPIYLNLYTGLFAASGAGKSTARKAIKYLLQDHFPDYVYSASIQSREDIITSLAQPDCLRTWKKPNDALIQEYRPFFILANEFKNFLSVNPEGMIDFLVDIYDERQFSTGFKKDSLIKAKQKIDHPYVSILACGVPEWLMTELRVSLLRGGLGRRLILVIDEQNKIVPDPYRPKGWEESKARVVSHLKQVEMLHGEIKRTDAGKKWWHEWYMRHKSAKPDEPVIAMFHMNLHIQVMKVACLLAISEPPFKMEVTDEHFAGALAMLEKVLEPVYRLVSGVGKNESAGVGVLMVDAVRQVGGVMRETVVKARFFREMSGFAPARALEDLLTHLEQTGQIVRRLNKVGLMVVFTPEAFEQFRKEQQEQEKPKP